MIKRTLYFGNPAYLSLRNAQLVLRLPEVDKNDRLSASFKKTAERTIPIEDIGIVVLDNKQTIVAANNSSKNRQLIWWKYSAAQKKKRNPLLSNSLSCFRPIAPFRIAFKIVSLQWFLQRVGIYSWRPQGCVLLSKLYLCNDFYSCYSNGVLTRTVVYCFQNCIFAMIFTASKFGNPNVQTLCIAFKIVSLQWFLQLWCSIVAVPTVVYCFQNCIFAMIFTARYV